MGYKGGLKIIDKYLIREYFKGVLIASSGITLIYLIFDAFERIHYFISKNVKFIYILEYYGLLFPWVLFSMMLPLASILACFMSIGVLSRNRETIALRALGVRNFRIFLPIFFCGAMLSLLNFVLLDKVGAPFYRLSYEFELRRIKKIRRPRFMRRFNVYYQGEGRFYRIRMVDPQKNKLSDITICEFDSAFNLLRRIDAKIGYFDSTFLVLQKGALREVYGNSEKIVEFKEMKLRVKEKITDFSKETLPVDAMDLNELQEFIRRIRLSGEEPSKILIDYYLRYALPCACVISAGFGAPLADMVYKIGLGGGIALSLFFAFLYWGIIQLGKALSKAGFLNPVLGAWLPNFIFLLVGIFILIRSKGIG